MRTLCFQILIFCLIVGPVAGRALADACPYMAEMETCAVAEQVDACHHDAAPMPEPAADPDDCRCAAETLPAAPAVPSTSPAASPAAEAFLTLASLPLIQTPIPPVRSTGVQVHVARPARQGPPLFLLNQVYRI